MECNKDEALRAKELAEKKFMVKDIAGARKLVVKAQNLYPGHEGIPQMIAALDVYLSAANKMNGEADWYGVLGVNPQADDETVRRHYRKLALMLHPDKNKSVEADGAFKLVSEAWSILSDKTRRLEYDQKRKVSAFQKMSSQSKGSPAQQGANGFAHVKKTKASSVKPPKSTPQTGQASTNAPKPKPNTFWTVCHRCKMQYEYLRVYLNHNLLCPHCHEPFLAMETAPPAANGSKTWTFTQQQQTSRNEGASRHAYNSGRSNSSYQNAGVRPDQYGQTNFQWSPFSGGASNAAQAASMVQKAYEKVRREHDEAQAATRREGAMKRKHHLSKHQSGSSQSGQAKRRKSMEDASTSSRGPTTSYQTGTGGIAGKANSLGVEACWANGRHKPSEKRDSSQFDIQELLTEKAKREICKKLHGLNTSPASPVAPLNLTVEKNPVKSDAVEENLITSDARHDIKSGESIKENGVYGIPNSVRFSTDAEAFEAMSVNVPDPDFYNFDSDRTERAFEDNQVWAAYDDDDGMPRYYAIIHNVISLSPFMMRISWLNSRTNTESGQLNWISSGLSKTCGDFRIGRHEINNSLNSFSHKVKQTKGANGTVRIYPRRGDVWAIYRNWSPDWNELTAEEVVHKYDMVEVLEDYDEKFGVMVIPLVKVAGFKTVFHQHLDPRTLKMIPRDEMLRFSHQVPSHLITGQEASNAPKGCRELDPAAIPAELLHIVVDVKEDVQENAEKNEEDVVDVENLCGEQIQLQEDDGTIEKETGTALEGNAEKFEEDVAVVENLCDELIQKDAGTIEKDTGTALQKNAEEIEEDVVVVENLCGELIQEDAGEANEKETGTAEVAAGLDEIREDDEVEPDEVMVVN